MTAGSGSPSDDQIFESWVGDLMTIQTQVVEVHHHRELWTDTVAAIRGQIANVPAGTPATWLNHYVRLYVDGQMMAVRRVVRGGPTETTLGRLLVQLERRPDIVSKDRFLERARRLNSDPAVLDGGRRQFESDWDDGTGHLDKRVVAKDRNDLFRQLKKVIDWADQTIAHIDFNGPPAAPTFVELDQAIEATGHVFQRYAQLLTGGIWYEVTPIAPANWTALFAKPLFVIP
jgi:hypothetical protein